MHSISCRNKCTVQNLGMVHVWPLVADEVAGAMVVFEPVLDAWNGHFGQVNARAEGRPRIGMKETSLR